MLLRRATFAGTRYTLSIDNIPGGGGLETLTGAKLHALGVRRVVGVANPFVSEFEEFLRARFQGADNG